ncbi:hypothetical protein L873DRAFT_1812269 [Choiromyces venosus 120613-1]|uniref:Uncharacterized protein n=1 Tax=Choiromyces venosus 120613-1 TaxID=1336337 RepID=A0A3N4JF56_9PEZI|nr:hypothetical protein L873DRAFT_1812269 [Choiromyces venosus 120613-1]
MPPGRTHSSNNSDATVQPSPQADNIQWEELIGIWNQYMWRTLLVVRRMIGKRMEMTRKNI